MLDPRAKEAIERLRRGNAKPKGQAPRNKAAKSGGKAPVESEPEYISEADLNDLAGYADTDEKLEEFMQMLVDDPKVQPETRAWYRKQLKWIDDERRAAEAVAAGKTELDPAPEPPTPTKRPSRLEAGTRATEILPLFRASRRIPPASSAALDGFVTHALADLRDTTIKATFVEKFLGSSNQRFKTPEKPLDIYSLNLCGSVEGIYKTRTHDQNPPKEKSIHSKKWQNTRHDKTAMALIGRAHNRLRDRSDRELFWLTFMACTAQAESGSYWQKPISRWVSGDDTGLFQLMPNQGKSGGNLAPCVDDWNAAGREPKLSSGDLRRVVIAPQQRFQVFCGVQKVKANLACQLAPTWTETAGEAGKGCVSPFNDCYNHFGSHTWTSNRTTDCMLDLMKPDANGKPTEEFDLAFARELLERHNSDAAATETSNDGKHNAPKPKGKN